MLIVGRSKKEEGINAARRTVSEGRERKALQDGSRKDGESRRKLSRAEEGRETMLHHATNKLASGLQRSLSERGVQ